MLRPLPRDYLRHYLEVYWFAPPAALWRAIEARVLARLTFPLPLLDFGCGHGLFAAGLFGTAGEVTAGCDLLFHQLQTARRLGVYRSVQVADGHHLPYAGATFATVFSNSVLEHIPDPAPVVQELARLLHPGGQMILVVPSDRFPHLLEGVRRCRRRGDEAGAARYLARINAHFQHHHYHPPEVWRRVLEEAGLRLEEARYFVSPQAVAAWDRANRLFGTDGSFSPFRLLASPRLHPLGYRRLLRRWLPAWLARRWRPLYEQDPSPEEGGGDLLLIARRP
ncbi:MAG: class I SAM-dependent methyltransferase [Chloroflexi bacterium]|nr:MAG: class I SAM-dependent methyltransferase [Chloroflexota bacterium]